MINKIHQNKQILILINIMKVLHIDILDELKKNLKEINNLKIDKGRLCFPNNLKIDLKIKLNWTF